MIVIFLGSTCFIEAFFMDREEEEEEEDGYEYKSRDIRVVVDVVFFRFFSDWSVGGSRKVGFYWVGFFLDLSVC